MVANRGRLAQQPERERHLVPEVDGPALGKELRVALVGARQLGLPAGAVEGCLDGIRVRRGRARRRGKGASGRFGAVAERRRVGRVPGRADVLVPAAAEERGERAQEAGRIAERQVGLETELEEALAEKDDGLGPGEDPGIGRAADLQRELADEPVAEGVKGRDAGVRIAVRDELVHPNLHLLGGLVGEGEGQDLGRHRPAGGDEPGDSASDDLGLARTWAGHDEHRTLAVRDRPSLLGVQASEQRLEPWLDIRRRRRRRSEAGPDRQLVERRGTASRAGALHRPGRPEVGVTGLRGPGGGPVHGHTLRPRRATCLARRPASGGGRRERRRRDPERLGFLGRERGLGLARRDGLGVDARHVAGVEAADDEAVARGIEEGQGKALVAARVLEGVEADEADS